MKKIVLILVVFGFFGCSSLKEKDEKYYNDPYMDYYDGYISSHWDDDDYCDYYYGEIGWDDLDDDEKEQIKDNIKEEIINNPEFRQKFETEYRTNPEFRGKVNQKIEEKYDIQLPEPRSAITKEQFQNFQKERIQREQIQRERIQRDRIQRERIQRSRSERIERIRTIRSRRR